jgi:hypothetical protein
MAVVYVTQVCMLASMLLSAHRISALPAVSVHMHHAPCTWLHLRPLPLQAHPDSIVVTVNRRPVSATDVSCGDATGSRRGLCDGRRR